MLTPFRPYCIQGNTILRESSIDLGYRQISDGVNFLRTTRDVLQMLAPLGATDTTIGNDLQRKFLMPVETTHTNRGRTGLWTIEAVRRAKRLYRLRQHGASGMMLRMLLFLADGWGWEHIQATCVEGTRKVLKSSLSGVDRYVKSGIPDNFAIDDIIAHQHQLVTRSVDDGGEIKPTSYETTAWIIGQLKYGKSLDGGSLRRIINPITNLLAPGMDDDQLDISALIFEYLSSNIDMRADAILNQVKSATPAQADSGRRYLLQTLTVLRRAARSAVQIREPGASYNILTLGGKAKAIDPIDFAKNPARATTSQVLGAAIGIATALELLYEDSVQKLSAEIPMHTLMQLFLKLDFGQDDSPT